MPPPSNWRSRFAIHAGLAALVSASVAWVSWWAEPISCDDDKAASVPLDHADAAPEDPPQPADPPAPKSILDAKQLGFGTVAGICTGVFVRKGLKLIAFALGGIYILLQYMASQVRHCTVCPLAATLEH